MSDTDSNPPRHNARWSDEQKRRVIALRRSGKTYDDIATTMGRTKLSIKSMCERLERAQYSETEHNKPKPSDDPSSQPQPPLPPPPPPPPQKQHANNNYHSDSEEEEDTANKKPQPPQPPPPPADTTTNNYNYTDYTHSSHSIPFGVGYPQQTTDDLLYEEHGFPASHHGASLSLPFDETNATYSNTNELQYPLSINPITTETESSSANNVITTQQQIPWPAAANHDGGTQPNITLPTVTECERKTTETHTNHTNTKQMDAPHTDHKETKATTDQEKPRCENKPNVVPNDNTATKDLNPPKTPFNTKEIEKQNSAMSSPDECKDKMISIHKAPPPQQNDPNDSDNDCIIISVLDPKQTSTNTTNHGVQVVPTYTVNDDHKKKKEDAKRAIANKASKGNQGSDAEYRRLIQKYGQSMRYEVGEIVTFFVPRLAAKGRFKDRIGKIHAQLLDTDSKYQIIDQQNHKQEVVPWKWILKAPPTIRNKRKRNKNENEKEKELGDPEVQQRKKHKTDRIPIQSLKTREEKIAEFNRRMNDKKQMNYKQYAVPIHASYYEDEDDGYNEYSPHRYRRQRGRSVHNYRNNNRHNHHKEPHSTPRNNGYLSSSSRHRHPMTSPPPPRRRTYHDYDSRPHHENKKKQVRSYSVFPQRAPRRRIHHSPLPPLQRDEDKVKSLRRNNNNNNNSKRERDMTAKMNVINIADDDEDDVEIKPEKHVQNVPSEMDSGTKYKEYPRKRSRSRSPSHIRPSNRIMSSNHNNNNNHKESRMKERDGHATHSTHHGDDYYRYRTHSPPRDRNLNINGYYDGMEHGRYHNHQMMHTKSSSVSHDSHYRYYRDYHVSPSHSHHRAHTKRSTSRSRSRERERERHRDRDRERERDRGSHHGYWREYSHPPSVESAHYPSPYNNEYYRAHHHRYDRDHQREMRDYRDHRDYPLPLPLPPPPMHRIPYEEDRYYRNERRDGRRDRAGMESKNDNSLRMQSWLQVSSRMRGGSKLGQREIDYLCQNDVYPEQIKQFMDSDKQIQEKYDMVAHYVDPTNGQNLTRSQVYSIIGAVITMKF